MEIEIAHLNDAEDISRLLNLAYRGEKGWTTEAGLIDGDRSTTADIKQLIARSLFLIVNSENGLKACISLEKNQLGVYIGAFAVHPDLQSSGLGRLLLNAAEERAISEYNAKKFIMVVLSRRTELIAYYERRGYRRTGKHEKYPLHLNVGTPKENDLMIEHLLKEVTKL